MYVPYHLLLKKMYMMHFSILESFSYCAILLAGNGFNMILTSYSGMARFGKCIGTEEAAAFTGYHSDIDRNSMTWMMNATWVAEYNIVHANDPQWMRTWGFVMFCACIGIIIEFLGRIFKSWARPRRGEEPTARWCNFFEKAWRCFPTH